MPVFRKGRWHWLALAALLAGITLPALVLSVPGLLPGWVPDLKGRTLASGPRLVLDVDIASLNEFLRREILFELQERKINIVRFPQVSAAGVDVFVPDKDRASALQRLSTPFNPSSGFAIGSGEAGAIRIAYDEAKRTKQLDQAAVLSADIIESRLSDIGGLRWSNPGGYRHSARPQPAGRIIVQVSQADDLDHLIELATKPGRLEFRLVNTAVKPEQALTSGAPPNAELLYERKKEGGKRFVVDTRVIVSGRNIEKAEPEVNAGQHVVSFRLNTEGARKFAQATSENVGRPFAIVLDNEVVSAPVIRQPIMGGQGLISGDFSVQGAKEFAALLRAGPLPVKLRVIERRPAL